MKKNWISWLALALSIAACIITWLRVEVYTTNDTFVGVMAGFMGACATILVGVQIYNSIEYRNKLQEIEKTQLQLREELKKAVAERAKSELMMNGQIERAKGLSLFKQQPFSAYKSFHKELEYFLEANSIDKVNTAINDLRVQKNNIIKQEKHTSFKDMDEVANFSYDPLEKYELSPLIKDKYDSIQKEITKFIDTLKANGK